MFIQIRQSQNQLEGDSNTVKPLCKLLYLCLLVVLVIVFHHSWYVLCRTSNTGSMHSVRSRTVSSSTILLETCEGDYEPLMETIGEDGEVIPDQAAQMQRLAQHRLSNDLLGWSVSLCLTVFESPSLSHLLHISCWQSAVTILKFPGRSSVEFAYTWFRRR